ncbi:Nitrogen-fixing NifU, C-terminal [Candidatus Burkholderia verschuerenii]|uniref:Nitrogen-fixing NifU, C-terminal n=1 Tax=Candidatus Burkholderia verschuerenii TaxID=242163 RepID=A0A0L0MDV0_9BURK|nr:sugar phosphate isomerase/epimerase [Candidatus Burkholderia verschuerenii]KND60129.1 Nitrogen-fixing NifU, C-terminal [Candidatus Burkholderia verschuerenii]
MRIAVSNIAWDVVEDETIAALLQRYGVDAIDFAPSKYFPEPDVATTADMARVKDWWARRGIEMTGMQSLLFGTTGLNVFGDDASRQAMLDHLGAVCRIGQGTGATRLVFGSPKNRDRNGLDDEQAMEIAVGFFRRLGDLAAEQDVIVCLEPNPPRYGANFMTTSDETRRVVEAIAHPAIRMQLDSGAIAINGETPFDVVRDCAAAIGHVHASEPDLVTVGDGNCDHVATARAVREFLPDHIVTIEMVATKDQPHHVSIERALQTTVAHYGAAAAGAHNR